MSKRTTKAPATPRQRTWDEWLAVYPGDYNEMADDLRVNRVTAWELRIRRHNKPPFELLKALARAFARKGGTADGAKAPAWTELFRAWRERP